MQSVTAPELWGYISLAFLVAIEGPVATLVGAAAAAHDALRLPLVFAAAATGNLAADILWYLLGASGHISLVYRLGRWLGVREGQIERVEGQVERHAVRVLLLAKLTAGLVIPALVAAGLLRVPWRRWLLPIVVVEMLWTGTLVLLGYHGTAWLVRIERGVEFLLLAGTVGLLLFGLVLLRRGRG